MSKKSWFKGLNKKTKEVPVPRDAVTIQQEYNEVTSKAGQVAYQEFIYAKHLEQLNQKLLQLNQEADLRNKLNATEASKNKQGATSEQS